jgi:hypothetical protein
VNKKVVEKINPILADAEGLGDFKWDVVLMDFFGADEVLLENLLSLARKRCLIFTYGREPAWGFPDSNEGSDRLTAEELEALLESKGYAFKKTAMEMQFGHPFKTMEDIHEFLNSVGLESLDEDAVKKIVSAEERIIKTNRYDFPYYLPRSINVALFIVVKKTQ